MSSLLVETAPAKINLTLRVIGRREDGYHELESLVGFASAADRLGLMPAGKLELELLKDKPRVGYGRFSL